MSNYSKYIKSLKENEKNRFFGEVENVTNKYFTFKHFQDEDNIIIVTANVKFNKKCDCYMLIVGNNKAVYVKDWCVECIHNFYTGFEGYAVKLNRKYFKPYTFKNDFEDFAFDAEDTFDSLVEVAKTQDSANMKVAYGFMG